MVAIKATKQTKRDKSKTGKIKKLQKKGEKIKLSTHVEGLKKVSPQSEIKGKLNVLKNTTKDLKQLKYIFPSQYITESVVTSALSALEKLTIHNTKKNAIFGNETSIFLEIRCIKIQNSRANIRFVLPHSTVASTGEVCLITPDLKKGKKPDHEPTIEHWEEVLRKANITSVKTILPMRQLRVEYDQFELKRRLLTQHDFIMVDTRVLNHVSHELGKMFFKKHNMLIPVKINKKDPKRAIITGLRSVMLRLNQGQTSTVLVGHTTMPQAQVKENILALVQKLKERYPGGERNIRSLSIKLPLSLSLPLYLTLRPSGSVNPPKVKLNKPKQFVYEDELTTKMDSIVRVAPDGTVHVKYNKKSKDVSDMEDNQDTGSENEKEIESDKDEE